MSYAGDLEIKNREGFSDPNVIVPMSETWNKQGIQHSGSGQVDLAVTLDQQLYPIILPLIEEFAANEHIKISVENGTCGISAGALAEKSVDIGGFCCPPGELDRLPGLRFHTIGIGAIAVIENPLNQLDNVSLADAHKLFGGQITHWSGLPMSGFMENRSAPVRAITRLHCKARPGHWKTIIDDASKYSPVSIDVSAIRDIIQMVSKSPFGIGYETLWHIQQNANQSKVKIMQVGGVDPRDINAVARGDYPFYRVFNLTTWATPESANPVADKLVAFLLDNAKRINPASGIATADLLRKNGWQFSGNEVVARPNTNQND